MQSKEMGTFFLLRAASSEPKFDRRQTDTARAFSSERNFVASVYTYAHFEAYRYYFMHWAA